MYLVGAPHPHKANAQRLLEKLITDRQRLVTDAEFLQEISAPLCRNRSPLYSVRSRLSWSIDSCLPGCCASIRHGAKRNRSNLKLRLGLRRVPWYCAPIVTVSSPRFQTKSIAGEPSKARPALPGCASFAPSQQGLLSRAESEEGKKVRSFDGSEIGRATTAAISGFLIQDRIWSESLAGELS